MVLRAVRDIFYFQIIKQAAFACQGEGKQTEYQGYIYTIYTLVRSNTESPGIVLMQILENTDFLITSLKNLNSNIKHYIDELTKHSTVAQIMDALFNDYITNVVDKAYHRLLTSDNVSKFRPEIIERLDSKSEAYMQKAALEIADLQEGILFSTCHMGIQELKQYKKHTKKLTSTDKKRLEILLEKKRGMNCDYLEVLEYMKSNDVKLEQECVEK